MKINNQKQRANPNFNAKLISLSSFGDRPYLNKLAHQLKTYALPNDTFVLSENKSILHPFNDVSLHFFREGSIEPSVIKSKSYIIQDDLSNRKNREKIVDELIEQYNYLKN